MRKFIVPGEQVDHLEGMGFNDLATGLYEINSLIHGQTQASLTPDHVPYFFTENIEKWLDDSLANLEQSELGKWFDVSDQDKIVSYWNALWDYDFSTGLIDHSPWLPKDETSKGSLHPVPQDLVVLLGIGAIEMFEMAPDVFNRNWRDYDSKLAMAQHVSAYLRQRSEGQPYPEGWIYRNEFVETTLPVEKSDTRKSVAIGVVDVDDPRLVVQYYEWFNNGSKTPRSEVVDFSPRSCEGQVELSNWAPIPTILANCMAFLDYAGLTGKEQSSTISRAFTLARARTGMVAHSLHGENHYVNDRELESEVDDFMDWYDHPDSNGGIVALDNGLSARGIGLDCHSFHQTGYANGYKSENRTVIYFDGLDKNQPRLKMMEGILLSGGQMYPIQEIAFRPEDIGGLVEALFVANQTQDLKNSPDIVPLMTLRRYGSI